MTVALYLFADEPVVVRSGEGRARVRLNGILKSAAAPVAGRLELSVRGPQGELQRIDDEITPYPPPRAGVQSRWARTLSLSDLGTHRAEWSLDGARSNAIELRVIDAPEPLRGPALEITPIPPLGIRGEWDLLVRLANLSDATLDRSLAFMRCIAIVDGRRTEMLMAPWDGTPELPPGERTWFLLALDDFEPRPEPGEHEVRIEMAGHISSAVRVTIPPR
jgi:hypothetical protein